MIAVPERILVLSPHPDDAELGCGGTIARFREEGKEVYVVVFTAADYSLPLKAHQGDSWCREQPRLPIIGHQQGLRPITGLRGADIPGGEAANTG